MVNIFAFEKAFKLTWIQRCLKNPDSQWYSMFQLICDNTEKLLKFGNEWCLLFSETLTNIFWKNILQDWLKVHFGTIQIYVTDKLTFRIGIIEGYI